MSNSVSKLVAWTGVRSVSAAQTLQPEVVWGGSAAEQLIFVAVGVLRGAKLIGLFKR